MRCPKCEASLPFLGGREKLTCPQCGTALKFPVIAWLFLTIVVGGLPWLIVDGFFFYFESKILSVVLFLVSTVIVALVSLQFLRLQVSQTESSSQQ